jgi:hypothetical protein
VTVLQNAKGTYALPCVFWGKLGALWENIMLTTANASEKLSDMPVEKPPLHSLAATRGGARPPSEIQQEAMFSSLP